MDLYSPWAVEFSDSTAVWNYAQYNANVRIRVEAHPASNPPFVVIGRALAGSTYGFIGDVTLYYPDPSMQWANHWDPIFWKLQVEDFGWRLHINDYHRSDFLGSDYSTTCCQYPVNDFNEQVAKAPMFINVIRDRSVYWEDMFPCVDVCETRAQDLYFCNEGYSWTAPSYCSPSMSCESAYYPTCEIPTHSDCAGLKDSPNVDPMCPQAAVGPWGSPTCLNGPAYGCPNMAGVPGCSPDPACGLREKDPLSDRVIDRKKARASLLRKQKAQSKKHYAKAISRGRRTEAGVGKTGQKGGHFDQFKHETFLFNHRYMNPACWAFEDEIYRQQRSDDYRALFRWCYYADWCWPEEFDANFNGGDQSHKTTCDQAAVAEEGEELPEGAGLLPRHIYDAKVNACLQRRGHVLTELELVEALSLNYSDFNFTNGTWLSLPPLPPEEPFDGNYTIFSQMGLERPFHNPWADAFVPQGLMDWLHPNSAGSGRSQYEYQYKNYMLLADYVDSRNYDEYLRHTYRPKYNRKKDNFEKRDYCKIFRAMGKANLPCHEDAYCLSRRLWPGYSCRCNQGYRGDGYSCVPQSWVIEIRIALAAVREDLGMDAVKAWIAHQLAELSGEDEFQLDVNAKLFLEPSIARRNGVNGLDVRILYTFKTEQGAKAARNGTSVSIENTTSTNTVQIPQEAPPCTDAEGNEVEEGECGPGNDVPDQEWAACDGTQQATYCPYDTLPTCQTRGGMFQCCNEDGEECAYPTCTEEGGSVCHELAYCDRATGTDKCSCPDGYYGQGTDCDGNAWTVRLVVSLGWVDPDEDVTDSINGDSIQAFTWNDYMRVYWQVLLGVSTSDITGLNVPSWRISNTHLHVGPAAAPATRRNGGNGAQVTINTLFDTKAAAEDARDNLVDWMARTDLEGANVPFAARSVDFGPRVYRWVAGSTADPISVLPTGMEVTGVFFKPDCLNTGCWVVDVQYTEGKSGRRRRTGDIEHADDNVFSVFFLPRTSGDTTTYSPTETNSFLPTNFPCGNDNYDPTNRPNDVIPDTASACCIPDFVANYRVVDTFKYSATSATSTADLATLTNACDSTPPAPPVLTSATQPASALAGTFDDTGTEMPSSYVSLTGAVDTFVGIYQARFFLDEVELRTYAGVLKGTVGVEHTVDTFIGYANFKLPNTGIPYLDMMGTQVAIHLEKTDFFSVSSHGSNDYTWLRYVNLRLVQVFDQDVLNNEASDGGEIRTSQTGGKKAEYVQVTFTVGSQYSVKGTGADALIPLDSVRVGKGTFFSDDQFKHACMDYTENDVDTDDSIEIGLTDADVTEFDQFINQTCAPQTAMCKNPASIDDQFVAFNIPVGFDWFPPTTSDLSQNVFVHFVVQAQNDDNTAPAASEITKTTLSASIPTVQGGFNIFCDTVTAKTDLKDVAKAEIVVGSASTLAELSRLTIIGREQSITSSVLGDVNSQEINTDSIESGLMTLVVLGNSSYFSRDLVNGNAVGSDSYGLEVEDVITIHIMESVTGFLADSKGKTVLGLINAPGDELYDSNNQLQTDGYALNGAFNMRIVREENRARINPSDALLTECSWAATTTASSGTIPTSCILRRDISGKNNYPTKSGASGPTAMELPYCADSSESSACDDTIPAPSAPDGAGGQAADVETFMQSILGTSDYAADLGTAYAQVIAKEYKLNNMDRRAFWINPGYEWTPTQTGGQSIFQISQKIIMFALINLNENRGASLRRGDAAAAAPEVSTTRRMLLAADVEKGSGMAKAQIETQNHPVKLIASTLGVVPEQVFSFTVSMALTKEQACTPPSELADQFRGTMEEYFREASDDGIETVQVVGVRVNRNGVSCDRRATKLDNRRAASYTDAEAVVDTVVAFDTTTPSVSMDVLQSMPGVNSVDTVEVPGVTQETPSTDGGGKPRQPGGGGSVVDTPAEAESEGSSNMPMIAGAAGGGVVVIAICAFGFWMYRRGQCPEVLDVSPAYLMKEVDATGGKGEIQADLMMLEEASSSSGSNSMERKPDLVL